MKHLKVGWWTAGWLLGMVAFGVYAASQNDWWGAGIDFGAALILWPLSAASLRDRRAREEATRRLVESFKTLADGGKVTLKKIEGGYEPVETPVGE